MQACLSHQQRRLSSSFQRRVSKVFTERNCCKAFEASGLVLLESQVGLRRLEIKLYTPSAPLSKDTPWQSKTPSNTVEFGSQSRLVHASFGQSLETIQDGFSQLVKGAELMLHQNALLASRNFDLEEQLAVLTKTKTH
jgi:hypothetical protein